MVQAARLVKRTCPRCHTVFDGSAAFCPNDGAALDPSGDANVDADPYIGAVILGDIEIKSVAGAGAMGRVYRAHQRGIDRDVAVKILHRELSGNASLVQRFHREAKIASKLQHPHVVEVYLAGQLPDGSLFIVMEYLDGGSLAAAMTGPMGLERALCIALQICDAVGAGHARGIVHRDLKPENVMLVQRADTTDWVKVLDFGIAKVNIGEQSMETAAGLIFGTARYISPEGAQGIPVGATGDVYSLAVMVYQLLSGHTPFEAEQPVGLLVKHIHDAPPPLTSWPAAASVPAPIARVVMDNLAKEPGARAPNARALGTAIATAAKDAHVSFSDVGVVARMSLTDLGSVPRGLDPTLDDASAMPAIRPSHVVVSASPTPEPPALVSTPAAQAAPAKAEVAKQPDSRRGKRDRATLLLVLAFLFGVAITAFAMQTFIHSPDREHAAHVRRAHTALARGNYVEPAGDSVRDLVKSGLEKWPDDSELSKIQSDAAHELVTHAMAARSGGDVTGARDLAKMAQELDPTDSTARLLMAQYEDELASSGGDGGGALGGPRVTLDIPFGRARPGGRIELVARITTGAALPRDVTGAQFAIVGPGLGKDGLTVPAGAGPVYRVGFTPPRAGRYEVQFEANVDGATVRADRTLDAVR